MIKKLVIGAILVVIGFFLVNYQINAMEYANRDDKSIEIYMLDKTVKDGEILKQEDFKTIRIQKDYYSEDMVTELPKEIMYYGRGKQKGDLLLSSDFNLSKPMESYMINTKSVIITLRMSVDEANGWIIRKGDIVDLYFIADVEGAQSMIYSDVKVCNILKQNPLDTDENGYETPEYVSIFVPKDKAMEILSNKEYGRYEIVIK